MFINNWRVCLFHFMCLVKLIQMTHLSKNGSKASQPIFHKSFYTNYSVQMLNHNCFWKSNNMIFFIATDEQLQSNRGCCFLVQAVLLEGFPFHQFNKYKWVWLERKLKTFGKIGIFDEVKCLRYWYKTSMCLFY